MNRQSNIWNPGAVMVLILLLCASFFVQVKAESKSASGLYNEAGNQYKAKQYEEAAANYEKILAQGYKNAEVYYNLGNCYYKLENTGKAILNYERALNIAPDDEDIQHNLKLANLKTIDRIQPVPQMGIIKNWNNIVAANSAKGWGSFSLAFIWAAFIAFAVYLFMGIKKVILPLGVLLLLLSVSCGLLSYKQNTHEKDSNSAVLTVTNVFAKSAPDENANDIFMIHEGIKFSILDNVGIWEKIRLADGRVGWIMKGSFEKI